MQFHQHTNASGEVLILRRIPPSRITNGNGAGQDFHWPVAIGAVVRAPDWDPAPECGHGLHGWPWGWGLGDGSDYDILEDTWLVIGVQPKDVVEVEDGPKCKFREGVIRFAGAFEGALRMVQGGFVNCVSTMSTSEKLNHATGNSSQVVATSNRLMFASSGGGGHLATHQDHGRLAASGPHSHLVSSGTGSCLAASGLCPRAVANGPSGCLAAAGNHALLVAHGPHSHLAVAGLDGQLIASEAGSHLAASGAHSRLVASGAHSRLVASGMGSQLLATGDGSLACVAADGGRVKVGPNGAFALAAHTAKNGWRFYTGKVGENGVEANIWYRVRNGRIVACDPNGE